MFGIKNPWIRWTVIIALLFSVGAAIFAWNAHQSIQSVETQATEMKATVVAQETAIAEQNEANTVTQASLSDEDEYLSEEVGKNLSSLYFLDKDVDKMATKVAQMAKALTATAEALKKEPTTTSTLMPTATSTSTPIDTPTATATPTPIWYDIVPSGAITTFGQGGFDVVFEAVEGVNFSYDQAVKKLDELSETMYNNDCQIRGRTFGHYRTPLNLEIRSFEGDAPLTNQCLTTLEELTGIRPSDKLFGEAVDELLALQGTGDLNTLAISYDGLVIGHWSHALPSWVCMNRGLTEAIGFDGEYFTVDPRDPKVFDVLVKAAFVGRDKWGDLIPNLCQNDFELVEQPEWVNMTHSNDAHIIEIGETKIRIHTDPSICTEFLHEWEQGKYLVDMDGVKLAVISEGAIVGFSLTDIEGPLVLAKLAENQLQWLKPSESSVYDNVFHLFRDATSIWFIDNIGEHITSYVEWGSAKSYVLDGEYFPQSEPELFFTLW
jgi:hypothetical protein